MASMYPALTTLRAALAAVSGVVTCKIGLETNMTPADYPMVRIVPSALRYGGVVGRRSADVLIYFGKPIHEFTGGMETLYSDLMTMESALIDAATLAVGIVFTYTETVLDEDRVDAYKLMAIRGTVEG